MVMTRPAELTPEQATALIAALYEAMDDMPRIALQTACRVIHAHRAKTPDAEDDVA
jgi:hypothetical protein